MAQSKAVKNALQRIRYYEKKYQVDLSIEKGIIKQGTREARLYTGKQIKRIVFNKLQTQYIENVVPTVVDTNQSIMPYDYDANMIFDELLYRIDSASNTQGHFYFRLNQFEGYTNKNSRVKGLHGGVYYEGIKDFLLNKLKGMNEDEQNSYARYLLSNDIANRLAELLDWNDYQYTEQVENKVTEILGLLSGGALTAEEAYMTSPMFAE